MKVGDLVIALLFGIIVTYVANSCTSCILKRSENLHIIDGHDEKN